MDIKHIQMVKLLFEEHFQLAAQICKFLPSLSIANAPHRLRRSPAAKAELELLKAAKNQRVYIDIDD